MYSTSSEMYGTSSTGCPVNRGRPRFSDRGVLCRVHRSYEGDAAEVDGETFRWLGSTLESRLPSLRVHSFWKVCFFISVCNMRKRFTDDLLTLQVCFKIPGVNITFFTFFYKTI